jgi:MFS family permease
VAAGGIALLAALQNVWLVLAAVSVVFVAAVALTVQLVTAAGDIAVPRRRAAVLSTYATFQDVGAAIGPLVGLSWGSLGTLRALFLGSALVLAVLAPLTMRALAGFPALAAAPDAPDAPARGGG